MTSKKQERETLSKIRKMVEALGADSYVGAALAGCLELAERNIDEDAMYSMQERVQRAESEAQKARAELESVNAQISTLTRKLDRAEGWVPYEDEHNAKQSWYEKLAKGGARELSDEEAIQMIAQEFGFEAARIRIIREVAKQEISLQRRVRTVGSYERKPLFDAWDYNYIRFNVEGNATMGYEMVDGELRLFWG